MTTTPLFFLPALQNTTGVKPNVDKTERSQTVPKKISGGISKRSTNTPEELWYAQSVAEAEAALKKMEEEEERVKIKLSAAKEHLAVVEEEEERMKIKLKYAKELLVLSKEVAEHARRAEEAKELAKEAKEAEAAEAASRKYKAWQCVMIIYGDPDERSPGVLMEINWEQVAYPQIINKDEVVTYGGMEVVHSEKYPESRDEDLASRDCYIQYQAALKQGSGKGEYRSRILFIGKYKPPVVPYGISNMGAPISTPMSIVDSVFAKVVAN